MTVRKYLQPCLGCYEAGDRECDGSDNEDSCSWRKRCSAFTFYLERENKEPSDFLEIEDDKAYPKRDHDYFVEFVKRLVKTQLRRDFLKQGKKGTNIDKRRKGPSRLAKKNAKLRKAERAKESRQTLVDEFKIFLSILKKKLRTYKISSTNEIIIPGQLYVYDRLKTSGYVGIRCKVEPGWDVNVVMFKLKTASMTFDVKFPLRIKRVRKLMSDVLLQKLKPKVFKDPKQLKFHSSISNVDRVKAALIAEFLAKIINKKKIKLPESY